MEEAKRLIKACLEKEEPFCGSSCPFHYDIREFTARLKRGSFNAAFRTFANGVGFPGIVSALCNEPCKGVCPRAGTDESINMRKLEKASIDYAVNTKPNSYNMPSKGIKIAIIGAGLSGLGCALRLCNRKYDVTVFEQSGRIGGSLWGSLPPEIFLKDIETQFMYESYNLRLNTKITDIKALFGEFRAVYIATGQEGDDFGLTNGDMEGVFLGGKLLKATDMKALAQGLRAAGLIEAYLKTGNMTGAEPHPKTRMVLDPSALVYSKPVSASESYTKEQAIAEAKRCIGCRCDACYRHCSMMAYFEKFPARIADEVAVTVFPGTLDGNGTVATRLISTCNQCGLCGSVCPRDIDVGMFLRQSHQAMREKGAMPWAFHDFWLRDMAHATGENYAFTGSPVGKPRYMFFPGCQLSASEPSYTLGAYGLLRKAADDTGIMLGCCGAPAIWAGDQNLSRSVFDSIRKTWADMGKPEFILACPTCLNMFEEHLPEIQTVFLLDHFTKLGIKPLEVKHGKDFAIFDPCAMRNRPSSRDNARSIALSSGLNITELPNGGDLARCCSFGGQIDMTNPPYAKWLVNKRKEQSELPYLVYCSNCRDVFMGSGKEAVHILELFEGCKKENLEPPGIEKRLKNRRKVKESILNEYFPDKKVETVPADKLPELRLEPGLVEKMDAERIFISDIARVIAERELDGHRIRKADGHYIARAVLGHMTYWAEYAPEDSAYRVYNAYAHRMKINED